MSTRTDAEAGHTVHDADHSHAELPHHDLPPWEFDHRFDSGLEAHSERQTRLVIALTLAMMVGEIVAGTVFHSMALLADGWHMGTHAGALGLAAAAYALARRHAGNPRFAFGTGKIGALSAFASAILLGVVAVLIGWESLVRLADPPVIAFDEAIVVAAAGLAVNLVSAWILARKSPDHGHSHSFSHASPGAGGQAHSHAHRHPPALAPARQTLDHDHNLRAAYFHVLADALTSVLAIVALVLGRYLDWWWMDLAAGGVGAAVIAFWALGLLRQSGGVLLDWNADTRLQAAVRAAIEAEAGDRVTDLHVWWVGPGRFAAMLSLVTTAPQDPGVYKKRLARFPELAHVTVEVHARSSHRPAR